MRWSLSLMLAQLPLPLPVSALQALRKSELLIFAQPPLPILALQ
ncbi:hypothetical protein OU5_5955 [Pseudomonas mandelii JR-1]|uniref:Uncharacterized protein n=1 Tax=Pseudomonas mandelii JR-1 TaxID=1147786 RepID=A0A024EJ98_9PSED|nr:hypothetical protein OU5_5955 [Pseudomonas mandelii JR-1]